MRSVQRPENQTPDQESKIKDQRPKTISYYFIASLINAVNALSWSVLFFCSAPCRSQPKVAYVRASGESKTAPARLLPERSSPSSERRVTRPSPGADIASV